MSYPLHCPSTQGGDPTSSTKSVEECRQARCYLASPAYHGPHRYRSGEIRKWLRSGRHTYLTQAITGNDDTLAIPASFQDGNAVAGFTAREAHLALV